MISTVLWNIVKQWNAAASACSIGSIYLQKSIRDHREIRVCSFFLPRDFFISVIIWGWLDHPSSDRHSPWFVGSPTVVCATCCHELEPVAELILDMGWNWLRPIIGWLRSVKHKKTLRSFGPPSSIFDPYLKLSGPTKVSVISVTWM